MESLTDYQHSRWIIIHCFITWLENGFCWKVFHLPQIGNEWRRMGIGLSLYWTIPLLTLCFRFGFVFLLKISMELIKKNAGSLPMLMGGIMHVVIYKTKRTMKALWGKNKARLRIPARVNWIHLIQLKRYLKNRQPMAASSKSCTVTNQFIMNQHGNGLWVTAERKKWINRVQVESN